MKETIKHYRTAAFDKSRREFSIHLLLLGMAIFSAVFFLGALVLLKWLEQGT